MEDYDEFNIIYILKIIEDTYIYICNFSNNVQPKKQAFGREGGRLRKIGIIAQLSDCIAFFYKPFRVARLIRLANKVNFSCQESNSTQDPP